MHHYPFHPGDYMLDTAHLEPLHDLCYRRALDLYYVSEAPLPDEKQLLSKRLRVAEQVLAEVLTEFFTLTEKGWEQAKCERVLAKYQATSKARQLAGAQGGRGKSKDDKSKQKQLLSNSLANAANHKPITNNQKPISLASDEAENDLALNPDGIESSKKKKGALALEIYTAYPRKVARDAALKAIQKRLDQGMDAQELLDATRAYAAATAGWEVGDRQFIPHPATWFNSGGFADEPREWLRGGVDTAKKTSAPALTVVPVAPVGYEAAMAWLWGEEWQEIMPAWANMLASDQRQVREWLAKQGKEAA